MLISPYTPNYFVPGIDVDASGEALAFLRATGWQTISEPFSMRDGVSSFRYLDYYDALGTLRGCLGGFRRAVALMAPTGSWVQRLGYLPGFVPETGGC